MKSTHISYPGKPAIRLTSYGSTFSHKNGNHCLYTTRLYQRALILSTIAYCLVIHSVNWSSLLKQRCQNIACHKYFTKDVNSKQLGYPHALELLTHCTIQHAIFIHTLLIKLVKGCKVCHELLLKNTLSSSMIVLNKLMKAN